MKRILEHYVYSNIHIALCSTAAALSGYFFYDISIDPWLLAFVFSGTIITYSLHRIISEYRTANPSEYTHRFYFFKNKKKAFTIFWLLFFTIVVAASFLSLEWSLKKILIPISLLSILYIAPIFGSKRLRDINHIKIFLIAFVWSTLFIIAKLEMPQHLINWKDGLTFLEKFLFIFALTLPFDFRDRDLDAQISVSTLANNYSGSTVFNIMLVSILGSMICVLALLIFDTYTPLLAFSLIGFYGLQAYLTHRVTEQTPEIYYLGTVDGLILLQGVVIILASSFR